MEFKQFSEKLNTAFKKHLGIEVSDLQTSQLFDFMNLLIEKNKVMNLTAITEPEEIILRHFVDSCIILKFENEILNKNINSNTNQKIKTNQNNSDNSTTISDHNFFAGQTFVDIGTGAGFPGLPLAIMCPDAQFTLTDTLGKRINFLNEVLDAILVKNTRIVKSRAEDFCHDPNYRGSFDFALSRGVAKISVLSEYSLPALKLNSSMLAYKMDTVDLELNESKNALKVLGGNYNKKITYDLISGEPLRSIVVINKISKTPKQYPRKAGTPSKSPL